MAYLTVAQFKTRTVMRAEDVDMLESTRPGYLEAALEDESAWIDGQLKIRYDAPFRAPAPRIIEAWLVKLVTLRGHMGLGFDPETRQDTLVGKDSDDAKKEIAEAADPNKPNSWNLPLRADAVRTSGIVFGTPQGYAEPTAYDWMDEQARAADERR